MMITLAEGGRVGRCKPAVNTPASSQDLAGLRGLAAARRLRVPIGMQLNRPSHESLSCRRRHARDLVEEIWRPEQPYPASFGPVWAAVASVTRSPSGAASLAIAGRMEPA